METSQIQSGTKIDNGIQMFNTVQNRLNNLNVNEVLSTILLKDIEEITEKQFEVLGGISYFVGLDFYSMSSWNDTVMTNVISRLILNGIDASIFNKYIDILQNFKENDILPLISAARVKLMDKIKSEILFDNVNVQKELMLKIRTVINNSLIPVEINQDLNNRFLQKDLLIYHDILVFNSFAYNESIFNGESSEAFIDLSNDPVYIKALSEASNFFELQKFGLFYEESILNFYNKNIVDTNENFSLDFFTFFLTEENITKYSESKDFNNLLPLIQEYFKLNILPSVSVEAPVLKLSTEDEVLPGNEVKPLTHSVETLNESIDNPLENPTNVIKHILFDFNKIRDEQDFTVFDFKNKPEALVELVESMLEVEDIVGSFYTFLSKYNELKNTEGINAKPINSDEFLNYSREELQTTFTKHIKELQNKYNDIIGVYVKELSEDDKNEIVLMVNVLLSKLYIGNVEDKGILLSQMSENTIFTNKHLHQIISTIESQYIKGSDIQEYIFFKNKLENDYASTIELFEESQKLESYELRIKLLHMFNSAFN